MRLGLYSRMPYTISLVVGFFVLSISVILMIVLANRYEEQKRAAYRQLASSAVISVERQINHSLSALYSLATLVRQSNGNIRNFDTVAAELMRLHGGLSYLQLAPDGVVSQIFPDDGSAEPVGHNVFADPDRRQAALRAVYGNKLTLTGPVVLQKGQEAILARMPVQLRSDKEERFWGFAIAVIHLQELVESSGIDSILGEGVRYRLLRYDIDRGERILISGEAQAMPGAEELIITLPNDKWYLEVMPQAGWGAGWGFYLLMIGLGCMICVFVLIIARQEQQIASLATHDSLTGAANRLMFNDRFELAVNQAKRRKQGFGLLYLDVDAFKQVNDNAGHAAGDAMLLEITRRLKGVIRGVDLLARIGGDEFVILAVELARPEDLRTLKDKVSHVVNGSMRYRDMIFPLRVSIGDAYYPEDGHSLDRLMQVADARMYEAKHAASRRPPDLPVQSASK